MTFTSHQIMIIFACLALFLALPFVVNGYVLSVLILALYLSYLGQAWNLMMGFAGQLSLGHALYVGLGAYLGAAFFVHYHLSPWVSMLLAAVAAASVGAFIAFVGFRFNIKDVHFTLLTIAFAECARVLFSHWSYFGASAGLFLPVGNRTHVDMVFLRGEPILFYYLFLGLTVGLLLLCRMLLRRRAGYYWLAIREDAEAAQSLGVNLLRTKMTVVALSGALSAVGGVVYAFYQNSLFPEQIFAMSRSIEILTAPIVGGIGTLLGPIVGALLLTPLGELFTYILGVIGIHLPGVKHLFYGLSMLFIMVMMPDGIWPFLRKRWGRWRGHHA